jgi:alanyl aminopeptidase
MFVKDDLDPRDAFRLLFQDPRSTEVVFGFLKQNYDALLARLPAEVQGRLPRFAYSFCDEGHRADVASFFKDRIGHLTGGPRHLAQTLEAISLCNAMREAQKDSLSAFLEKY